LLSDFVRRSDEKKTQKDYLCFYIHTNDSLAAAGDYQKKPGRIYSELLIEQADEPVEMDPFSRGEH
jgi:hypothetical protein